MWLSKAGAILGSQEIQSWYWYRCYFGIPQEVQWSLKTFASYLFRARVGTFPCLFLIVAVFLGHQASPLMALFSWAWTAAVVQGQEQEQEQEKRRTASKDVGVQKGLQRTV